MISGSLRNKVGAALIVLAVALFVVPALFPVQSVLTHDTRRTTNAPAEELRQEGVKVVAYENLTERGQELYAATLENGGEYSVPATEGARDFSYPNVSERRAAYGDRAGPGGPRPGVVVVERPVDGSLPESDEHFFLDADEDFEGNETRLRRQALRHDMMQTRTEQPPLGSPPQLLRLGAVVLAVIFLGTGGYFLSSKG